MREERTKKPKLSTGQSLVGVNSADDDDAAIDVLADLFLNYLLSQQAAKVQPSDVHIDKAPERS